MASGGLTPSNSLLLEATKTFFAEHYEAATIQVSKQIDVALGWSPSLHLNASEHLTIAAELSDTPYPEILRLRHAQITNHHVPIAVYSVCPEEAFLLKEAQPEVRDLQAHGYGLITIDQHEQATRRFSCIPLIQHIPDSELRAEIAGLPKRLCMRIREAFDKYKTNPVSGLQDLSEVMEGLIYSAARASSRRGWVRKGISQESNLATVLDELAQAKELKDARASIGGVRGFVKQYRNASHHFPKNRAQAYQKYRAAQHGFRDGLKQIQAFRKAFSERGISVKV